ncbi:MAG: transporter substrate-binding domain-containing protein [Pontimonas sp.]|nr:transporter substrate-binding domain-containing protein [Pontimonas sp.]
MSRTMTFTKGSKMIALLGAAAVILAGCAAQAEPEEVAPAEEVVEAGPEVLAPEYLNKTGVVKYCATLDNPPRGFLDEGSRPVGFEVELGVAMADLMDLRVEWIQLKFDGIIAALQANQCDVIVQELFIREARLEIIDMVPFSNTGQRLVVRDGVELEGTTLEELSGVKVAVPNGTSIATLVEEANVALKEAGKAPINVQVLPTTTDTFALLDSGTVDVVGTTTTAAAYYVSLNPTNFKFLGEPFGLIQTGFGINKDNPDMTRAIQEAFDILVSNGTYAALIEKFGLEGSEL